MAKISRSALTVADTLGHGAETVSASCWRCNRIWRSPIMMLPPETTLAKIQALMQCRECGCDRVHVEPVWPEGAPARH